MDLFTQGLLGSCLALSAAKPDEIRKASLIGLLAGLAADLDFFIKSSSDPLLNLEFHRHFTHSIFFIPVAAFILSFLFWPFFAHVSAYAGTNTRMYVGRATQEQLPRPWKTTSSIRNRLTWKRIFLFCLLGYSLSGLLDASTSYGTRLLWPVSDQRISFNIISIVDPVFTSVLLLGVLLSFKTRKRTVARFFLLLCLLYLVGGWFQHQRVEKISRQLAVEQGHSPERLLVKPTLGNLFLWRSVYLYQGEFYVNAIRLNPFSGQLRIFQGEKIRRFNPTQHDLDIPEFSVLQKDIHRFSSFTDNYLALYPQHSDIIIDVRYSNLPNSILPLWGIQIDIDQPERHASYQLYRDKSSATRNRFLDMLFNN